MGIRTLKQHSNSHTCTQPALEEALRQSKRTVLQARTSDFQGSGRRKKQLKEQHRFHLISNSAMLAQVSSPSPRSRPARLGRDPHLCHAAPHASAGSRCPPADKANPRWSAGLTSLTLPRSPASIPAREGSWQAAAPKLSVSVARLLRREPAGSTGRSPLAGSGTAQLRCLQSQLTECKTKIKNGFFSYT